MSSSTSRIISADEIQAAIGDICTARAAVESESNSLAALLAAPA
jgi:hypothetical protein